MKRSQKWLQFIYTFSFSKQDKRGLLVLLSLIFITLIFRIYYPFWLVAGTSPANINLADLKYSKQNSYEKNRDKSFTGNGSKKEYYDNGVSNSTYKHYTLPAYVDKKTIISLNEADTMDLQELRGIGATFAKRIYNYRERLGGFVKKEQLMEVWGLDTALYHKILPYIKLGSTSISKININEASVHEIKKHPYLDYYQAKEIVKYRENHGKFTSLEQLKEVNLMDMATYQRLKDYLCISQ